MARTRVRRLPRHLYTGERSVAFTACTKDREVLFLQPKDIDAHVDNLRRAADACDCVVPIYCFMPDHLHVMFKGLDATSDTLAAMVKFKLLSGLWFRRKGLPGGKRTSGTTRFVGAWTGALTPPTSLTIQFGLGSSRTRSNILSWARLVAIYPT